MRFIFTVSGPAQGGSSDFTQLGAKTKMPLCSCQSADFTGLPGTSQHRVLHHIGNNGKGKGATLDSCCASRRHFENMSGDLALIQKLLNIIRLSL